MSNLAETSLETSHNDGVDPKKSSEQSLLTLLFNKYARIRIIRVIMVPNQGGNKNV